MGGEPIGRRQTREGQRGQRARGPARAEGKRTSEGRGQRVRVASSPPPKRERSRGRMWSTRRPRGRPHASAHAEVRAPRAGARAHLSWEASHFGLRRVNLTGDGGRCVRRARDMGAVDPHGRGEVATDAGHPFDGDAPVAQLGDRMGRVVL
eukprot:4307286-Prymnesium_polylepis.1